MKLIKRITVFLTALAILLSLTACGNEENKSVRTSYDKLKIGKGVESGNVAENDRFSLAWDEERACVIVTDKTSGTVWSTIPYDYYKTGDTTGKPNSTMGSPLTLKYVSTKNMAAVKSTNGYTGVIKNGRISSKKIENGIKVFYCFDKLEIVIPVDYTIDSQGINISIAPKEIIEYDNLVYKISVAPFMCSAANSDNNAEHYIVVPSGSGALMYTNVDASGKAREYAEMVYGKDPVRHESEKTINTSAVRLPMFGAKDGETALCGIINDGAACAEIEAQTGDEKVGRSAVWATFALRGSNVSAIAFNGGQTTDVENISKDISLYEKLSVGYYPLYGEDADYSGMASVMRKKLQADAGDKKVSENPLNLNILGGLQVKALLLGLPYQKTITATTLDEATEIIKNVKNVSDLPMDVVLSGFGSSGLDIGKIAGGFGIDSVFGSKKDYENLSKYCDDGKIGLFTDFDIVNFNTSSNGFSKTFDAAKSSNSFTAYQYHYSVALRNTDNEYERYVLLSRASLGDAAQKLMDKANKKKISGIGLSTLGNTAYSDYDSNETGIRKGMEDDVVKIVGNAHKKGLSVLMSDANAYAAAVADKVINVPVTSSMFDVLNRDIPLYQMVFKGVTDISVPINTATNPRDRFLSAVECGTGMTFVLSARYESDFATSKHSAFAVSLAEDNIDLISELSKESKEVYAAVGGAEIEEHIGISDTLRKTVFDNGVTVWVNYGNEPVVLPEGTVEAKDFMFKEGV